MKFRPTLEKLDDRIVPSGNGNPHFVREDGAINSAGSLVATFKEAGLASGSVETITVNATVEATYASINHGGHHPQAANKETFISQVSASGEFTAGQNGNVTGTLTLTVPPPPDDFGVPGQTIVLADVSYVNITIVDSTSGAMTTLPDQSRVFFDI